MILQGMTCKELTFQGAHYNYDKVPMELTPFQRRTPRCGTNRPPGRLPWAARNRVNVVWNLGGPGMRAITDRYRAEWAALDNPPHDLPLMGVGRHIVIAETRKEALEIAKRGYHKWRESFLVLWHKHNMLPSPHAIFPKQFDKPKPKAAPSPAPPTTSAPSCRTPSTKAV